MTDTIAKLLLENVQPRPGRGGWHGGPTPLGAVRGVSAEQAAWVPFPGRKSIWQLALHIAYWKYAVRGRLEGGEAGRRSQVGARRLRAAAPSRGITTAPGRFPRSPANWPSVPQPGSTGGWKGDVALLRAEHEQLLAVIEAIPSRRYGEVLPGGKRWTVGELILGSAQHDAYHAGQIQMLKRLWAASQR